MNAAHYLGAVADALAAAGVDAVFVGGATIGLYLDPAGAAAARATEDVDCIVDCAALADYDDVSERLRAGGFSHCLDEDAPNCRWVLDVGPGVQVMVDVMPTGDILGFANRFYPGAVASAKARQVGRSRVRLPTAGFALATKVAAWQGRGRNDPFASKDFEDIIALADGCWELLASVDELPGPVRAEVAAELRRLLGRSDIRALVQGTVPQPATAARVQGCLATLRAIAAG
ncbi:MAG: hypothetical protein HY902_12960 [Deltaproteobacteria bacterium]|nr:hypothetical protein [Deltaproteobacteria bacterium]